MLKQVKSGENCQRIAPRRLLAQGNTHQDSQKLKVKSKVLRLFLLLVSLTFPCGVEAQIVEDNTLPNPTVVNIDGNLMEITGGTTAGTNLFHSFEQFSVLSGATAWFNNLDTIANIISRVTGGSVSNIDGLIRANGTANLFLINPSGIVFGAGAALDIGGSFLGSTADSLIFEDGTTFSATNPEAPPLLTVSIPLGLQYGSNPGNITVRGSGHSLSFVNGTPIIDRSNRPVGLQVNSTQSLALVGGNVTLDGGNLTATEGQIEVGSVGGSGIVELKQDNSQTNPSWTFNYDQINNFGDINLVNSASLEVSGNGAGHIQLTGNNITVIDGSAVLANTQGNVDGANITITATEALQVVGSAADNSFVSYISGDVDIPVDADIPTQGNGGDIEINTGSLLVAGGGQITNGTLGLGSSGSLSVTAQNIEILSGSAGGPSGLFSSVAPIATGNGGNIDITTDSLLITDGAQIASATFGSGDAGTIEIEATQIQLTGTAFGTFASSILANVQPGATGNGGELNITTQDLSLIDGAQIFTSTLGLGDAGNLDIQATEIELTGISSGGTISGLFSSVLVGATGDGGSLILETDSLNIRDGAQIASATFGVGNAGSLEVQAKEIGLIGGTENVPSSIFTNVEFGAEGNGGSLTINTDSLQVLDGASITVATFGSGNAGNATIEAEQIELIGFNNRGRSGLFASAIADIGNGGTINVNTDQLSIQNGATVSVSNFQSQNLQPPGTGAAGSLEISADEIVLDTNDTNNPSTITASTFSGDGGEISLQVDSLAIRNGSEITAEARGTSNGGSVSLNSDSLQLNSGARISTSTIAEGDGGIINITADNSNLDGDGTGIFSEAEAGSSGNGGNINFTSDFLSLSNDAQISANTAGIGQAGSINFNGDSLEVNSGSNISTSTSAEGDGGTIDIIADNSNLDGNGTGVFSEAEAGSSGDGGNINFTSDSLFLSNGAQISANSFGTGQAGNINIFFDRLEANQGLITATSILSGGGNITLTTLASELILRNNSLISTSVLDSTGGGGDILINADFIWARDNSDIRANAVFGNGGNIQINTETIFLSLDSNIDASSQFGVNGEVTINSVEIDKKVGTVELPQTTADTDQIATGTCPVEGDSFVVTGRGGLPIDPRESIISQALWTDLRPLFREEIEGVVRTDIVVPSRAAHQQSPPIEAQGWVINSRGKVELVAKVAEVNRPLPGQATFTCSDHLPMLR